MNHTTIRRDFLREKFSNRERERVKENGKKMREGEKVVRLSDAIEDVIKNVQREKERDVIFLYFLQLELEIIGCVLNSHFERERMEKRVREGRKRDGMGKTLKILIWSLEGALNLIRSSLKK